MKLDKETKEVDFIIKSEPWSEKDIADFRELMQKIKRRNRIEKERIQEKSVERLLNPKIA